MSSTVARFSQLFIPTLKEAPADAQVVSHKLLVRAGEDVCAALAAAGVDVLYDDRDERPGVKFKDADLIGLPIRIAVGKRGLAEGKLEWKWRGDKAVEMVALGDAAARAAALVGR